MNRNRNHKNIAVRRFAARNLERADALRNTDRYESIQQAECLERAAFEALLRRGLLIPEGVLVGPVRP